MAQRGKGNGPAPRFGVAANHISSSLGKNAVHCTYRNRNIVFFLRRETSRSIDAHKVPPSSMDRFHRKGSRAC